MKTKYKYIHFIESQMFVSPHQVWLCKDKTTTTLAQLYYYDDWKQYVASFNNAVFSADCLIDIQDFLNQLNKEP